MQQKLQHRSKVNQTTHRYHKTERGDIPAASTMDDVQRCHELILQQRTQIRHHKSLAQWMKRCWHAAPHAEPETMTIEEYQDTYSVLLYEMTVCWDDELNDAILTKLWKRDTASHGTLNFDRFCCSIFYFAEMWVEEISMAEYEKIFTHVYRILSNLDLHLHNRGPSHATRTYKPPSQHHPQTFKPTLESFNSALDNDRAMDELQVNFGKSISFDAQQYYQHFGTPTTHLQAFQATLLRAQSRVRVSRHSDSASGEDNGRHVRAESDSHFDRRVISGARSPTRQQPDGPRPASPPQRPMSSSGRARYVLEPGTNHASPEGGRSPQRSPGQRSVCVPSPVVGRAGFLVVGKTALS